MVERMSVEVQWTDTDPDTGERRFVSAERFARQWTFKVRFKRRENWRTVRQVTRQMWEDLLESLERRYQRREGVEESELLVIRKLLAAWPER
jgi:hypothetical protein